MTEAENGQGPTGLRERQKLRRRARIADEALLLFDRQGFQETTLAQIADAAEVSPRTVSSYFPAKEDLAFPDQQEWLDRFRRLLAGRGPDKTALEGLSDWAGVVLDDALANRGQHEIRRRVIDSDLSLKAHERGFVEDAAGILREEIARDLNCDPDDLAPRIAAAATMAVFEVMGEYMKHEGEPDGDPRRWRAEADQLVDRAVRFISGGLRATAD